MPRRMPVMSSKFLLVGVSLAMVLATAVSAAAAQAKGDTAVSGLTLTLSTTAAGGDEVSYQAEFTASASGALAQGQGTVTLALPTGSVLHAASGSRSVVYFRDVTNGATGSEWAWQGSPQADTGTLTLPVPIAVAAGDQVTVTYENVTSAPTAGRQTATFSTSSDTEAVPAGFTLTAGDQRVTALSAAPTTTAARASEVNYQVEFTASATGGLVSGWGTVTFALPAGSVFHKPAGAVGAVEFQDLTSGVTGTDSAGLEVVGAGGATLTAFVPIDIAAGDKVRLTYVNITNATVTGQQTATFSTSSDTSPAVAAFTLTAGNQSVSQLRVTPSTLAPGASGVRYQVQFTASPTGGLVAEQGTVTLALPQGSVFPQSGEVDFDDLTTGATGASFTGDGTFADGGATLTVVVPFVVAAGDRLTLVYNGVTNAPTGGDQVSAFSTSSDTTPADASLGSSPGKSVEAPDVTLSSTAPGGTAVYNVSFTASAGGGMAAGSGGITLAGPAGTVFSPAASAYAVADVTTDARVDLGKVTTTDGGATVVLAVGTAISPFDQIQVTASGVTNPAATGNYTLNISTSGDTALAPTPGYHIGSNPPVFTAASPSLVTAVGATERYTFAASGYPAPSFTLSGAPAWLSVNSVTGQLGGVVPAGTASFSYSVKAANSSGTATEGLFTVTVGASALVSGRVVNSAGEPVADAEVDGCDPAGGACESATSDDTGAFTVTAAADSTILLTAYPPPGSGVTTTSTDPFFVPADGRSGETITVQSGVPPIPGGLLINGSSSPVLNWSVPSTASLTGCANGLGAVSVIGQNTKTGEYDAVTIPLTEAPAGSGDYAGMIPPVEPVHGPAEFDSAVYCPPSVTASRGGQPLGTSATLGQALSWLLDNMGKIPGLSAEMNAAIAMVKQAVHPNCSSAQGTMVASIMLALAPELQALGFGAMVILAEGFPEVDPLLAIPALRIAMYRAVVAAISWIVKQAVQAAVKALWASVCNDIPDYNALIDPDGTVLDTTGHPVQGATVTILKSFTKDGAYLPVSTSSPGLLPAVNPEVTGAGGAFHWDVDAGWYKVSASASGCTVPGSKTTTAVIGPYPVPPPQLGLTIILSCPAEPKPSTSSVTSLSVTAGPAGGGTVVTVLGDNFTLGARVAFGATPARSVTYLSPQALMVTTTKGAGLVDVRVTTAGGTSTRTAADRFFFGSAPKVTTVCPAHGPAAGSTMMITGQAFAGVTSVSFGGVPAKTFTVLSATRIAAVTPAGAARTAVVQVANPAGGSALIKWKDSNCLGS